MIPERLLRESQHSVIQFGYFLSEGDFLGLIKKKVICIAKENTQVNLHLE